MCAGRNFVINTDSQSKNSIWLPNGRTTWIILLTMHTQHQKYAHSASIPAAKRKWTAASYAGILPMFRRTRQYLNGNTIFKGKDSCVQDAILSYISKAFSMVRRMPDGRKSPVQEHNDERSKTTNKNRFSRWKAGSRFADCEAKARIYCLEMLL